MRQAAESGIFRGSGGGSSWVVRMMGTSASEPKRKRTPLNVYGPTDSIPTTCAAKAKPQMSAAKSSSKRYFMVFSFG